MSSNEQRFKYDSNYKKESSFTHIKFGHDLPLLETELNEAQILQEKARTSLARRLTPSGFTELTAKEFNSSPLLYNPFDSNGEAMLNHIAIAPSKAIINGYELMLEGNFKPDISSKNNPSNYILVDLGEASDNYGREDLVYLEVWFQILTGADNIQEHGYINGNYMGYQIIDPRVNAETARRVALYWNIKISNNVMFNQFPNGFGYESKIEAQADGGLTFDPIPNVDIINQHNPLIFISACDDYYKECEFYQDSNLYVAGRPQQLLKSSSLYDGYVFAMPLFKVVRRNKNPYSIENIDGTISELDAYDSIANGDLAGGIRPDKLTYDSINPKDILDLRHIANVKEFKQHYYLDKTINSLFSGTLQTKEKNKIRRVQFGMKDINYNEDSRIQYNIKFNGSLVPFAHESNEEEPEFHASNMDNIQYMDSLNGYGLYFNGSNYVRYNLYNNINVNEGAIDFYFQPYWYGPSSINQTIFTITNSFNIPVFIFEKSGKYLIWTQYFGDGINNTVQIDLTNPIITSTLSLMSKNIYHIRLAWSKNNNSSGIYINGNCISGRNMYPHNTLSSMNPYWLQLGKKLNLNGNEDVNNTGFIMENFTIYNSFLPEDYWPNLPKDFIGNGDSLLLPSFNSNLSNFSDNLYIQHNTTSLLTSTGGRVFMFNIPNGENVTGTSSLITTDYATSLPIDGVWEEIDDSTKMFTTHNGVDQIFLQYTTNDAQIAASTIINIDAGQAEVKNIFEFIYPEGENVNPESMSVYDIKDGGPLYLASSTDNQSGTWLDIADGVRFIPESNDVTQILLTYKNNVNTRQTETLLRDTNSPTDISKFTFEIPESVTIETSDIGTNAIEVTHPTSQEIIPGYWIAIDADTRQFITKTDNAEVVINYTILSEDKSIILNSTAEAIERHFTFILPENKIIDKENIKAMTVVAEGETSEEVPGSWEILDENTLQFSTIFDSIEQILAQYTITGEIKTTILSLTTDLSGEFIFNIPYGKSIDNTSLQAYNNYDGNLLSGIWSNIKSKFIADEDVDTILLKYTKMVDKQESVILDKENEPINWESIFNFNATGTIDHDSLKIYDIINGSIINEWEHNTNYSQFIVYSNIEHILLQYTLITNTLNSINISRDRDTPADISRFTFDIGNQTIEDVDNIVVKNFDNNIEVTGGWINVNDTIKQFVTQEVINTITFSYNTIVREDKTEVLPRETYINSTTFKLNLLDSISGDLKVINNIQVVTIDPEITVNGTWSDIDNNTKLFTMVSNNINRIKVSYDIIGEINQVTLNVINDVPNTFVFDTSIIPNNNDDNTPLIIDSESLQVYDTNGNDIINGKWVDITKKFNTIKNVYKILLQYDLILPPGNGGYDLPNEIIGAGIVSFDANTNSTIQEISYCKKGSTQPREIEYVGIGKTNGITDRAYDYPLTYTTPLNSITMQERCFARLLYYYQAGNGTDTYTIKSHLYGYEVIGIIEVINKKLKNCKKLDSGVFVIELTSSVETNDIIEFKLALGGLTFEYETQSKTLISNIHKTKILQFTANGTEQEYIIPAYDVTGNGGIIKSIFTFTDNGLNNSKIKRNIYFIKKANSNENTMFILNDPQNLGSGYKIAEYDLQEGTDSFGTPFLKITLRDLPAIGDIIEIPVLISYQPTEDVNISLWYDYNPYQGILSNTTKQLKRLTDWKYFITTLSSGNVNYIINDNVYSFNNIINRIPGGMTYAYCTTGESVAFQYISDTFLNDNIDDQLIFTNNVFFSNVTNDLNNTIFPLITDLNISKSAKGFQDGILTIQDFSIFLPECLSEISKYIGMACIVVDENGELLLLVIGNLDKNASKINELIPTYGDLFRIQGLPTIVKEVL